jgi:hypothetical protein
MTLEELERRLADAEAQSKQAFKDRIWEKQVKAWREVIEAQRALAAFKGEQYAVPIDLGFFPENEYTSPILLQTDYETILTFIAKKHMPDGSVKEVGTAIIKFERCSLTKFGHPNDEALPGHSLYSKGLGGPDSIYEVHNSQWVKEKMEINRVSFPKTLDLKQKHFIFTFHENTLECIASGMSVELSDKPYYEIFTEITKFAKTTERILKQKGGT